MKPPYLDGMLSEPDSSIDFTRIGDVQPRSRTTICGMVVRIRTRPSSEIPPLEIAIEDPSGTAYAVWPGRRRVAGIGLGRRLLIEGVAAVSSRGPLFVNPVYRLLPER